MIQNKNNEIKYPRGSESRGSIWRKWDLHIHSDSGSPEEIVDKLIEKGISVFSITDHSNVDKIDEFLEIVNQKQKTKKEIYFLPGVELKTDKGKKSVHLIGIFPLQDNDGNKIDSNYLKQNLLSKIDCSDTDIIKAGKEVLKEGRSEEEYRKRGYLEIVVNFEKAARQIKELGGIRIVHAGTKSSGIEREMRHAKSEDSFELWNSLGHTKRSLMKDDYIDVCELSNWNAPNLIERDFYLKNFGKPSVVFSDAHTLSDVGKKYTWIKADPTFEGLKQIIYEPKLRISEKPELYLYPQIISVQLQGAKKYQTLQDKENFPPITLQEKIWFNPNLTTIIGPRASGKTVLVELLSYPFNKHLMEVKKEEKLPLVPFLAKRFPDLIVTVFYQQGEQEAEIKRKITDLSNPFYTSPLNIEYWRQGQIEEVADKKEKINEYIRDRLSSPQLLSLAQEIDKLKEKLKKLREKCFYRFETEIKQGNLLAERKQIEEYFEKLKTQEYKNLIKKIRENRAKNQLLDSFIKCLEKINESLNESKKQISFTDIPEINQVLELFSKDSLLCKRINEFYRFIQADFIKVVKNFEILKGLIEKSQQKKVLEREELQLKNEFLEYCKKSGIKITQAEYERRTSRLKIINRELKDVEAKLREYTEAKQEHNKIVQVLQDKIAQWKRNNEQIIKEFNKVYSKSNIRIIWEDPINKLSEWIKEQFLASDSATKLLIRNNYHVSSPVRADFVGEITKELVVNKKYSVEKIIEFLQNQKRPPLEESGGKEENLKWFFQREETRVLREDLIMRLQEYGETGNNLIQYKKKILGKDTMSFGERCGTVIELILHSGDHPLIIDQPEEHLDSKFIAGRVVDIIREQKINRQIIVCTHNANIVVLGDSELVIVLSVDEKGTRSSQGSLENLTIRKQIYDVLEGGQKAFEKREQKYGFK